MKNHKTVPSVTFFFTRRTSLRFIVVYFGYFIWLFSIEGFFSSKKMYHTFLGTFLLLGRAVIAFQIFKRIMKLYTFNQTRKKHTSIHQIVLHFRIAPIHNFLWPQKVRISHSLGNGFVVWVRCIVVTTTKHQSETFSCKSMEHFFLR